MKFQLIFPFIVVVCGILVSCSEETDINIQPSIVFHRTQSLGASATESIALGDIDSDGDLDLIEGNGRNEPNTIWINNGNGKFIDSGQALGTNYTYAVALGDIDNDGDLDLVVGNVEPNTVWFNDGLGNYIKSDQALGTSVTLSIVLGDMDSDGDLDFIAGNGSGYDSSVWMNDGEGKFANTSLIQDAGSSTSSIALGDVDGDNDLDLVAGSSWEGTTSTWLNNGHGAFTKKDRPLEGGELINQCNSVALGDIDNDGDLDLILGESITNSTWKNNGSGTFNFNANTPYIGPSFSVALGDIDKDGDLDLVSGNNIVFSWRGSPDNTVWTNDGDGTFNDTGLRLGAGAITHTNAIAIGDVDGDDDLDIVFGDLGSNDVFLNETHYSSLR
jgi:fructose-specific component phosphotransferase system IIB-like protein